MPYIKKEFTDRIYERQGNDSELLLQTIEEFAEGKRREGASYKFTCPKCGAHSLSVTPGKMMFKCFSCNEVQGKSALNFLMSKAVGKTLPEAIEYIANSYGMAVEYEEQERKQPKPSKKKSAAGDKSFCSQMLESSGLTGEDVTARVKLDEGQDGFQTVRTFQKGSLDERYNIDPEGDDMIIKYFDLDGNPCTFTAKSGHQTVEREYFRVRFQFPDAHTDKQGKSMKYRSPYGAPVFIYYPERIREIYRKKEQLDVLYIQEGEKKAGKACKHGILSVAISGIQNIGYKGKLPAELVKLIRECKVKEVVFLMDSDLHDITKTLREDDPVERRPKNFFYAVKNYKEYMSSLRNQNIELEIYYGHVLKNQAQDKGIDDLLTNSLKGREDDLLKDILEAKNEKSGTGQYVQLYKITTTNDAKILTQFDLQSPKTFCEKHREELKALAKFTAFGREWRFSEDGKLESAQPIEPEEKFYSEEDTGRGPQMKYSYVKAIRFLENRGFYRIEKPNEDYDFVHVEKGIVKVTPEHKIVDYIFDFTKDCLPEKVLEMLFSGGSRYMGSWQIGRLAYFHPIFNKPQRGVEFLYFANEAWKVTAESIENTPYGEISYNIWADQKHDDFTVTKLDPLINIYKAPDTGAYSYVLTSLGRKCDFLQFLINTSNFTWRKKEVSAQELEDNAQHLVSKLCAFGYLVSSFKDMSVSKAVVAMDGKPQEFDEANGRTGKSLFGQALRKVVKTKQLNGKEIGSNASTRNQFIWEGIDEKTRLVIGDDLMRDFDFDMMFSLTTADWPVNPKNKAGYTIPFSQSPKIFLNSNYAIAGDGASYSDRQWPLAFSDFYNDEHKPIDDFQVLFFEEWDADQWNLFWNFAAQCVQIYFRFGYVTTPDDRLEERRLTQQIGPDFLSWADEYFDENGNNINQRIARDDMYKHFLEYVQQLRGSKINYSSKSFSQKLKYFVRLRNLYLNPAKYNPVTKLWNDYDADGRPKKRDVTNSKEYFTVGNAEFYRLNPPQTAAPLPDSLGDLINFSTVDDDLPE